MSSLPPATQLRIQERFVSIQGEGALVGTPSQFIRVSGCNLRCDWCDSPASSWAPEGEMLGLDQLVEAARRGPRHVVVTGGEPLLFDATTQLVARLREAGHHITIETAGTVTLPGLHCELMSISPKLAHSTPSASRTRLAQVHEAKRFAPAVLETLRTQADKVQFKYVVRAAHIEADLEEIDLQLRVVGDIDPACVFLMPQCVDPLRLANDYATLLPHCIARGNSLGQRLHIAMFGHTPGT